ncbi:chloride channel protein [Candidatus Venteria ishoeyi]|uniref:chloride channel protein n=1 Tax=Candidatus Venteria ishoeyi TaxID=1899563 RepID=UPI0025A4D27B|nr:chloride channel protein [Candidatus Venteria ishoeyi]MDM8547645.1 chloride channel protein [Candidatus Venteria ishoeyi]
MWCAHPLILRVTLLSLIVSLLAAGSVLLFRYLVEFIQIAALPEHQIGGYESLPGWLIFALPSAGGLLLGLVFHQLPPAMRQVGILHVLLRMRAKGRVVIPGKNTLLQFFAGIFAIVCGQSVDREGPGVHLGAGSGAKVANLAGMEEAEGRILVACGVAAAIAAAFNTPLAGIIFVIEVLEVAYQSLRFLPIMASAVLGALLGRFFYGAAPAFNVPALISFPIAEMGYLLLLALVIGLLASGFIALVEFVNKYSRNWSPLYAFTLAGLITGLLGQLAPEILGVGYDSLSRILSGELLLYGLLAILACKFLATGCAIGLRVPGGVIGPSLLIGGTVGAIMGTLLGSGEHFAIYPLVGMLAMMGATLQAPLAALAALLELTGRTELILPGTLAVVSADLISRVILGRVSVFSALARLTKS